MDEEFILLKMANPESSLRLNIHWSAPPVLCVGVFKTNPILRVFFHPPHPPWPNTLLPLRRDLTILQTFCARSWRAGRFDRETGCRVQGHQPQVFPWGDLKKTGKRGQSCTQSRPALSLRAYLGLIYVVALLLEVLWLQSPPRNFWIRALFACLLGPSRGAHVVLGRVFTCRLPDWAEKISQIQQTLQCKGFRPSRLGHGK